MTIQPTPKQLQVTTEMALFFEQLRKAAFVDRTQSWTAAQRGTPVTLTSATNIAIELNDGNNFTCTIDTNATLDNPTSTPAPGQSGVITFVQDPTGSRTLAFGSQYQSAGGAAVALSTGPDDVDNIYYYVKSETEIHLTIALDWLAIP